MAAIAEWAVDLPKQARCAVGIVAGPPCESTIGRVLGALDGDGLDEVVSAWAASRLPAPTGRRGIVLSGDDSNPATADGNLVSPGCRPSDARQRRTPTKHDQEL